MKCTNKALSYVKRVATPFGETIPDSIYLVSSTEDLPKDAVPKNTIIVGEKISAKDVVNLANSLGVNHVVQATPEMLEHEVMIAVNMIQNVDSFMSDPLIQILTTSNDKHEKKQINENKMSWNFRSLEEREGIKSEISGYLESVPGSQHVWKAALAVADELLTNALYHNLPMPVKEPKFEDVRLKDDRFAMLFLSYNDGRLVVGCKDPFGSLKTDKLLRQVWASYRGEKIQSVNMNTFGAGIGCRMVFNHSVGFLAGVKPGASTIVCSVIPLGQTNSVSIENTKNLHIAA